MREHHPILKELGVKLKERPQLKTYTHALEELFTQAYVLRDIRLMDSVAVNLQSNGTYCIYKSKDERSGTTLQFKGTLLPSDADLIAIEDLISFCLDKKTAFGQKQEKSTKNSDRKLRTDLYTKNTSSGKVPRLQQFNGSESIDSNIIYLAMDGSRLVYWSLEPFSDDTAEDAEAEDAEAEDGEAEDAVSSDAVSSAAASSASTTKKKRKKPSSPWVLRMTIESADGSYLTVGQIRDNIACIKAAYDTFGINTGADLALRDLTAKVGTVLRKGTMQLHCEGGFSWVTHPTVDIPPNYSLMAFHPDLAELTTPPEGGIILALYPPLNKDEIEMLQNLLRNKYLKYKNKYLKLKDPNHKLLTTKDISNMSEKELKEKYLKYKNKYNQIKLEKSMNRLKISYN